MQLVKPRVVVSAAVSAVRELLSAVRELRTMLHDWGWFKGTVVGVVLWALASAAFAATVGVGALNFDALACEHPGEMFSQLDHLPDTDIWFNTPWTFGVAAVCIAVSIQFAHLIRLRTVIAVAWCSIPWQASFWHGLLILRECYRP